MFGTFRYLLAAMVVVTHLGPGTQVAWGVYGVWGFFVVSGYLMAWVLDRTYPYSPEGLLRYGGNRALRLYPAYLVVCLLALGLIALWPEAAASVNPKLRWHEGAAEWLSSFLILGQLGAEQALVPPAWSLHLEIVFYALMALGLARGRTVIAAWLVASIAITTYLLATDAPLLTRYASVAAASLPFACGAAVYAWRDRLPSASPVMAIGVVVLFVANAALATHRPLGGVWGAHFYLSLVLAVMAVALLSRLAATAATPLARWDRGLGDLSYPIFLAHYPVGVLLCVLAWNGEMPDSLFFLLLAFALSHAFALALDRFVERPVEALRDRVRGVPVGELPATTAVSAGS